MIMEVRVSAPGKVILHGEHAVVYGKPAIATSLNLRSEACLLYTNDGKVELNLPDLGLSKSWEVAALESFARSNEVDIYKAQTIDECFLKKMCILCDVGDDISSPHVLACITFLYMTTAIYHHTRSFPSIKISITSKLPLGAGLGSSASFNTCLAASLLIGQQLITPSLVNGKHILNGEDLMLINNWAYQGERIIHGNPSGIDNSVATFGGALKFQCGKITKFDSVPRLRILLTDTRIPRSTKALVAKVRQKHSELVAVLDHIMDAVEAITDKGQQCLVDMTTNRRGESNDAIFATMEDLIDMNQHLLEAMGVSHASLDRICHVTAQYKLHSKLTGAGGGGCAFTLLRPDTTAHTIDSVQKELTELGYHAFETEIGCEGITCHHFGIS